MQTSDGAAGAIVQTTAVATSRATQIAGGGRGANGGSSKRPPYKKGDIVKVLFKSVKDMFGQHQSEWYTGAVVKTRVTKDSKQTIDVQFSHDYRLQIDGCPRPEVSKQDGVTSMDSPIFYPPTFGAGDLVDVYFENQTRKLNRGRVLNVSEDTRRVGVVYYEDNYMRGGRYEASIPTDEKKIRLVERLGANLGWMNGKSAVINGRTGTVKSCGQPDACCRVTFNERESTAVSATEAAKGVLGIIMSRLEVTVWPVDPPARLSAEARLSRQAGGRSVSVKSGNRGAAETASRTSHEKALPSGAKPVDSATNTTTLGQARVHSNSAASAPSARPFSDRRNAAVVNPDHRVSADWRREVARDKRVKMLVDIFPFVSSKLGDKMSKEHKITVTKHLEDLLFRESPSFDTYIDMSTLKFRLEKLYQKISKHNKMAKAAKQQQVMGQCAAATGATPAVMAEENSQLAVLTVAPQAKHALSSLSGDTQSSSKRQKLPSSAASHKPKDNSQGRTDSQTDSVTIAFAPSPIAMPLAASLAAPQNADTSQYRWIEDFTSRVKSELSSLATQKSQLEAQKSDSEKAKAESVQLKRDLDEMRRQLAQQKTLHEREMKALQTKCDAYSSKNDALNAQIVRDKATRNEAVKALVASHDKSLAAAAAKYAVELKHIRSDLGMANRKVDQLTTSNSRLETVNEKLKTDLANQLKSQEAEEKRTEKEYANDLSALSIAHKALIESMKDEMTTLRKSGFCLEW